MHIIGKLSLKHARKRGYGLRLLLMLDIVVARVLNVLNAMRKTNEAVLLVFEEHFGGGCLVQLARVLRYLRRVESGDGGGRLRCRSLLRLVFGLALFGLFFGWRRFVWIIYVVELCFVLFFYFV